MNVKTVLAVVVLGCLVAIPLLKQNTKVEPDIGRISFRSIDFDSADSISVKGANPILLKKEKGVWVLPTGREVESNAVKRALDALKKVESTTQVASVIAPDILKKWGLDDQQGTAVVVTAGTNVLAELTIGKVTAGRVPLLVGSSIFSVTGIFPGVFSKSTQAWQEKRLFPNSSKRLEELRYYGDGTEVYALEGAKEPETGFVFPETTVLPEGFRFDSEIARSVTSTLMGLRVHSFVDSDLGAEVTGLNESSDRVSFVYDGGDGAGNQKETLVLGGPAEGSGAYASFEVRKDTMVISASSAKVFRKAVEDFRDLRLMNLEPQKIVKLVILDGKSRLILVKKGDQWVLEKSSDKRPEGFEFDAGLVQRRLSRLVSLKAVTVAQPVPKNAGFKRARASITAVLSDTSEIRLEFGKKVSLNGKEGFYAKGNADELLYVVSDSTRRSVLGMLSSFDGKRALRVPPGLGNLDPATLSKLPPNIRQKIMQQIQAKQPAE